MSTQHAPETRHLRVLVIDDDPLLRMLFARAFRAAGHTITCAASFDEGRAALATERFDIVLTDVYMPDADGLEVLKHLRTAWPELRVVVMSGRFGLDAFGSSLMSTVRRLGAVAVLPKPIPISSLLATVEAAAAA